MHREQIFELSTNLDRACCSAGPVDDDAAETAGCKARKALAYAALAVFGSMLGIAGLLAAL